MGNQAKMLRYKNIFSSFTLAGLTLKNRLIMAAMGNNLSHPQGTVSEKALAYYAARGKGGVGLIITEASPVSLRGRHRGKGICVYDDSFLPGLRRLVETVHEQGAAIALQLHHAGSLADPKICGGLPLAPSSIAREGAGLIPQEMTDVDIQEIIAQFGQAAQRAKEAGFDAVEIHGAHGYLIHQFFSPRTNRRQDNYGGNTQNRARFALKVLQEVKKVVGEEYPIIFRLSAKEYLPGGYDLEEAEEWAYALEWAGASALHISAGSTESLYGAAHVIPPMALPVAFHLPLAAKIKRKVKIPVIAVGRLGTPEIAEQVLQEGQADLVAAGRAFLVDPYWPAKAGQGEEERIRPCVACNYCLSRIFQQEEIACFQNGNLGREVERQIQATDKPKKVFVIGGGPAGLEAARVAREHGHQVTIFEKNYELGGQMLLAHKPPYKQNLLKAITWIIKEMTKAGVKIRLNAEVEEQLIEREKPEAVIVATGAEPIIPEGISAPILTAWDVLQGKEVGEEVLILGGGMVGIETAEYLAQKGCKVTVVEMQNEIAMDMEGTSRALLLQRLPRLPISIILASQVLKIEEGKALIKNQRGEKWLRAEYVVLALGARSKQELAKKLAGKVPELILIGDAKEPRRAKDAIHEGFLAALSL